VATLPTTGLQGWYDASDASTFSFSSGVVVSQWRDKSAGAHHFNGGALTRNGTQNGLTTVVATGGASMKASAPMTTVTDNFAIFAVCKRTGGPSDYSLPFFNGEPSFNGYGPAVRANGTTGFLRGAIAWHSSSTADDGGLNIHTLERVAGTWGHYVNGVSTSASGATGAPNGPNLEASIPDTDHTFSGDLCEFVVYDRALTTVERQQVETYLTDKWIGGGAGPTPVSTSRTTTWNVAFGGPKVGLGRDTTVGTGNSITSTTTLSFTHGAVAPSETLIVAIGSDNTTNATLPTVSSITKDGSESGSWVLIGNVNSSSSGSAGGVRGFLYAITATVPWAAGSKTITFSAAVVAKAAEARTFYGVTTTPRGTNPSGTTNGAGVSVAGTPTATTSGTAPITGDLVVGVAVNEATTAPSVDSDTSNGAWVGFGSGAAGNTGTALTSAAVRGQYKIVTAGGNQTLDPTCSGDSGVAVVALVPQQLATITANRTTTWNVAVTGAATQVTASRSTNWYVGTTLWKGVGVVPEGHVTADNALLNVSWFYDWASYSISGHEDDTSGNVQYVPMMWGDWENDTRWGVGGLGGPPSTSIGSASILLGFNEPDDGAQSNMSVGRALELWPLLEATGARLGSPAASALNTSWLASFMAGASGYIPRVDFICLHDYPGWGGHTLSGLADYIDYTYATYHKPIWLTEVSNLSGDPAYNAALIPQVMSMLSTRPFVERVGWFSARENGGYPGCRLVENTGVLTVAGTAYASYPSRIGSTTPVTVNRSTTWNVAAPLTSVSASRTTTWANRAPVATATRTTTWTVRTEVKPSRTTTWSTRTVATATRTTTWSTLTTVATATRTTSWAVRAQVLPTRTTTWGVLTSVTAATRTTTWAVRAQVLPSRTTTWAVLNPPGVVSAARTTTWSTSGPIATVSRTTTWAVLRPVVGTASRTTTWAVRSEVAVVRTSTWVVLSPRTVGRTTTWAVLSSNGVAVSRTTTWEVQQSITRGCTTTWTVLAPMALVIAARTTLWTVRVRANASRTTTWEVLPSVPSSGGDYLVLHPDTVMYLGTRQIKALYKDQSLAWSVTPTTLAAQGGSGALSLEE